MLSSIFWVLDWNWSICEPNWHWSRSSKRDVDALVSGLLDGGGFVGGDFFGGRGQRVLRWVCCTVAGVVDVIVGGGAC